MSGLPSRVTALPFAIKIKSERLYQKQKLDGLLQSMASYQGLFV